MDFSYTIVKRAIKNPRLEFRHGDLYVFVPNKRGFDIDAFIHRHRNWILKHKWYYDDLEAQREQLKLEPRLAQEFTTTVERFVAEGATILGIAPKALDFKNLKSRWGSCTNQGKITINTKLRYFPDELIGYVIFHEMIHLLVHSHGPRFYAYLTHRYPTYKAIDKKLMGYEYLLHKKTHSKE